MSYQIYFLACTLREHNRQTHKDTFICMLTVVVFMTKHWKPPECLQQRNAPIHYDLSRQWDSSQPLERVRVWLIPAFRNDVPNFLGPAVQWALTICYVYFKIYFFFLLKIFFLTKYIMIVIFFSPSIPSSSSLLPSRLD